MKKQIFFFILSLTSNYTKCAELPKKPSLAGDSRPSCKEEADDLVEHLKLSLLISSKRGTLNDGIYYFKDSKGRLFEVSYYAKRSTDPSIKIEEISSEAFELLRLSGSFYPDWLTLISDFKKTKKIVEKFLREYQGPRVKVEMLPAARERETSPESCSSSCSRTPVGTPEAKRARRK